MRRHEALEAMIEPILEGTPYELVGIELSKGGHKPLLRIYLDKEGGITLKDISALSREISAILDVEQYFPSPYNLEVSSPGLERPLYKASHFVKQIGQKIQLQSSIAVSGRQNFKGILQQVENGTISLLVDGQEHHFSLEDINKAKVVPDIIIGASGKK
jgi:ribosome maturation factor RimP